MSSEAKKKQAIELFAHSTAIILFNALKKRALDEFIIEGIKTTIPFHSQLMDNPMYIEGNYTTKFMEDFEIDSIS